MKEPVVTDGLAVGGVRPHAGLNRILAEIAEERAAQHAQWGSQHHLPDGTGTQWAAAADTARMECDEAAQSGQVTWRHILLEEVTEAFAEEGSSRLRAELVQVAAVAVQWIQAIDHRVNPTA